MGYDRFNVSRIREKVADIRENLQVLNEYTKRAKNDFLSNKEAVRSARYAFIVMIEASSNIANHLCARMLNSSPDSYAECFLLLGNSQIISADLSLRLGKMAGFRNILVHGYAKVDDHKMFEIMQNNMGDVEQWLEELQNLLTRNGIGGENDV